MWLWECRCERRPENSTKGSAGHKSSQAAGAKPSLKRKNSWDLDDVQVNET